MTAKKVKSKLTLKRRGSKNAKLQERTTFNSRESKSTLDKRIEDLFESAPIAYGIIDADGRIRSVNPRYEALTGYPKKSLIGRRVLELYADSPEGKEKAKKLFELFKQGNEIRDEELELRSASGELKWISLSVSPIKAKGGSVIESRSMLVDITRRKEAEKAIKEAGERYRDLFESAYDVLFLIDLKGNILDINRRGEQLTGYSQEELIGSNIFAKLIVSEDHDSLLQVLEDVKKGKERLYEVRWKTKDGEEIHFEGATTSRRSETGEFQYTRCTLRDITARKKTEIELERKNIALREILSQIEKEKHDLHDQIQLNIDRSITPFIQKLKGRLVDHDLKTLEQIESNLKQMVSPFIRRIETQFTHLSPRELEICISIRNGLASKEIAKMLNLSVQTVHQFRKSIRHKLGISNKETNLTSFLSSLNMQPPKVEI